MNFDKIAKTAQQRIVARIEQVQGVTIEAVSAASERIAGLLPTLPRAPLQDRLPAPEQVVTASYSLAESLVKTNRKGALGLLKALEPIRSKVAPGIPAASNGTKARTRTTTKARSRASA